MKLDQYLRDKGIKASEFAARLGRPASTITRLINGDRRPSLSLMQEIALATNGDVMANDFMPEPAPGSEPQEVA
jgi:transcriptional regulator with XRE-family HTH domain